jgi:hypothetical protein
VADSVAEGYATEETPMSLRETEPTTAITMVEASFPARFSGRVSQRGVIPSLSVG